MCNIMKNPSKLKSSKAKKAHVPEKHENHTKVFGSMNCGYTVKLLEELQKHGVKFTFVDTNTPKGNQEYKKHNVDGVPLTVCTKSKKRVIGYMPVDDLMKKLGYN